jgi:hypothetical protein
MFDNRTSEYRIYNIDKSVRLSGVQLSALDYIILVAI